MVSESARGGAREGTHNMWSKSGRSEILAELTKKVPFILTRMIDSLLIFTHCLQFVNHNNYG